MVINWYGEGCFKVQTGGLTLLSDPFDSSTGLTPARGKNEITIKTLSAWPLEDFEGEGFVARAGGEYEVQEVLISGFPLVNESTEKFLKTVYLVTAEEMKLVFLGHMSEMPEPSLLGELKNPDILFMPAGGKPFLNQEAATKLIKQIGPKIVVASFFKTPGLKRASGDWKELADEMGQKPEVAEKLTVRKKDTQEQKGTKLVILKI